MSDLSEVKNLIDEQGRAWQEFKRANDELIKAKADGKAVSDLESKLAVMSEVLDESKARADALVEDIKRLNRPAAAGADAADPAAIAAEVKSFNDSLRADYQSKGRPAPAPTDACLLLTSPTPPDS